jgi:hypothetical protein
MQEAGSLQRAVGREVVGRFPLAKGHDRTDFLRG